MSGDAGRPAWSTGLDGSMDFGRGYNFATIGRDGVSWCAHVPARDADLFGVDGPFEGTECSTDQAKQEAEAAVRRFAEGMRRWAEAFGGAPSDGAKRTKDEPVPMLLWCPECGERHIDAGEFATKPHHTHACQHCGMAWRPAVVPTAGVLFLPGFRDEEPRS